MALDPQLDELIHRMLPVVQDFHSKGMFAPHAASVNSGGELTGQALTTDGSTQLSVSQAIEHFETTFAAKATAGQIRATGIFYHSPGLVTDADGLSAPPANTTDECRTIVGLLEHASGDSVYLLIPYSGEAQVIEYAVGKLIDKPARIFVPGTYTPKKPWWKLW